MSVLKRLTKSVSIQGTQFLLSIVQNILLVPFFLSHWGNNKYGEWLTLYSIFNLLMALDNGFGQFFSNEFNRNYHEDKEGSQYLLGSCLRVVFLSSFIQMAGLICFMLIPVPHDYSRLIYFQKELAPSVLLLVIYRAYIGGFKGILVQTPYPLGLYYKSALIGFYEFLIGLFALVLASYFNLSLFQAAIIFVITKSIYATYSLYQIKLINPSIFPWWRTGSFYTGFRYYVRSIPLMINYLASKFSVDGINILISSTLGAGVLPAFVTVKTLSSTITKMSSLLFDPTIPEMGRLDVRKEYRKMKDFITIGWLSTTVIVVPILIISSFADELYSFWLKDQYELDHNLYVLLMVSVLLFNFGRPIVSYFISINHTQSLLSLTVIRSLISFGGSIILIKYFNLTGVGLSLLLAEALVSIFGPVYLLNKLGKGLHIKRKNILINTIQLISIAYAVYVATNNLSFFHWIVSIILLIIFGVLQYLSISSETRDRMLAQFVFRKRK